MNEAHRGVLASPLYFSVFHRCSFIYQGKLVSKKALATKIHYSGFALLHKAPLSKMAL